MCACLAAPCMGAAQEPGPPPDGMGPPSGEMVPRMNVDKELSHMTKRYALTGDQQTQVRAILEDEKKKTDALSHDSSLEPEDMFTQMKAIREDQNTRIAAVLTDEQRAKYESDQKKMERRQEEEGPDGPPPPDGGGGPPAE